jgi:hypothetical protein
MVIVDKPKAARQKRTFAFWANRPGTFGFIAQNKLPIDKEFVLDRSKVPHCAELHRSAMTQTGSPDSRIDLVLAAHSCSAAARIVPLMLLHMNRRGFVDRHSGVG